MPKKARVVIITSTGQVMSSVANTGGAGLIAGFIINSNSSGTLKLEDSIGGGQNLIMNTYTFPAGSSVVTFPAPIAFQNGLYATVGGTLSVGIVLIA